ncbi:hypothetical protein D5086_009197 [Populus alba]|uniref:Uncharacterized protein n=1 Tax=Populus alba TaxID=43335 RepID=A0ACC4CHT9_POPAL
MRPVGELLETILSVWFKKDMESISLGRHPKELYGGVFTRSRFWGNVTAAGDRFKFLAVMPAILAPYCSQSWSIPLAKAK